ncbi:MAG: hypothetical protein CBC10_013795 [Gammaproteobacteria bacterium TMED50]|nr:MAG: hypothetical protein CBC10_013795 [Gammaproteobacteria bacterium TMED50]
MPASATSQQVTENARALDDLGMASAWTDHERLELIFPKTAGAQLHDVQHSVNHAHHLWRWDERSRSTFESLSTYHFTYEYLPDDLFVRWQHPTKAPESLVLLVGDQLDRQSLSAQEPGVFRFTGLHNFWSESGWEHATLIPEFEHGASDEYTGRTTIALWLSERRNAPEGHETIDWAGAGEAPSWRLVEAGSDVYLVYAGSLFDILERQPDVVRIKVSDETRVPVTSQFALFKLEDDRDRDRARAFVAAPHEVAPAFHVRYLGTAAVRTNTTIEIRGLGRINGDHLQHRDLSHRWHYRGLPRSEAFRLSDVASRNPDEGVTYQQVLEYQLSSGLVTLSSTSRSEYAITLDGLTVTNAPSRHQAAINLNVVTLPMASFDELRDGHLDFAASNRPVHVSGLKVVGNWHDAADGPEVGGDGSLIEHVFLHVADDAIKLAAKNVRYRDVTVLQGDAGGVMNIGSYGYNRGVEGSFVEGVYVHRVCHRLYGEYGIAQDDDRGGLITSRTGNFNFLGQGSDGLTGFTVDGLWVAPLSGNSVSRVLALGVMGGRETTRSGFVARHAPVTGFRFGDVTLRDLNVSVPPSAPILLYRQPITSPGEDIMVELVGQPGIRIEWTGPGSPEHQFRDHYGEYDFEDGFVEIVRTGQSRD